MSKFIEGYTKLIEPCNVADPVGARLTDEGQIVGGKNGRPLTRTIRTTTHIDESTSITAPYDGGNNVRGKLRRMASEVIFDALLEKNEKIKVETYNGMTSGAVSAQPKTDQLLLTESRAASEHIFFGLFGGGPRLLPSGYQASPLLPILKDFIDNGIMPYRLTDVAIDAKKLYEMTEVVHIVRKDDVLGFTATTPEVIEDYENRIEEKQEALMDNKKKRKAAKDEPEVVVKKSDITNMGSFEVMRRGMNLRFRIDFKNDISDAQLGLMIMAIQKYAEKNIGGCGRIGFGKHKMNVQLFDDNVEVGDVLDYDGATINISDDMIDYVDAAHDAINDINADELDRFMSETGYEAA